MQHIPHNYWPFNLPPGEYWSFLYLLICGVITLVFGLVYQLTDSYRPAIFALVVFFVLGGALLLRVDTAKGIRDAGNQAPAVM